MSTATAKKQQTEPTKFKSRGHGDKRPHKQQAAIIALLSHRTIPEAAKAVEISEVTLWRWLQEDEFRAKYREAQATIFDDALGKLQGATMQAFECLVKNLDSSNAWVSVQSARAILHYALKSREIFDLEERLNKIESALVFRREAEEKQRLIGER